MKEIWKDIPGFQGFYQASNIGRIRSLNRVITRSDGISYRCKGIVLSPNTNTAGYLQVGLGVCGKVSQSLVHRLVAFSFLPAVKGKTQINHINGIPTDNVLVNLEWCNGSENVRHAWNTGLSKPKYGENNHSYKKSIIGTKILTGEKIILKGTAEQVAKGFAQSAVWRCANGRQKFHKGYTFKYGD